MRGSRAGTLPLPDEDLERALCDDAAAFLEAYGYAQYEISNFAMPGFACRHNLKYWLCQPYLGLALRRMATTVRRGMRMFQI